MKNIFALGDSVMKGIITDSNQKNAGVFKYRISDNSFVYRCERILNHPIENLARFGNTIETGLDTINRYLGKLSTNDIVILEFGGNDCNFNWEEVAESPTKQHFPMVSLNQFSESYKQLITRIKEVGAIPILLSLPILESQLFFDYISRELNKNNILEWLGGNVNYINNWHEQYNLEIFKLGLNEEIMVIDISTIFLKQRDLNKFYCADGMHPNENGHKIIADTIIEQFNKRKTIPQNSWGMVS